MFELIVDRRRGAFCGAWTMRRGRRGMRRRHAAPAQAFSGIECGVSQRIRVPGSRDPSGREFVDHVRPSHSVAQKGPCRRRTLQADPRRLFASQIASFADFHTIDGGRANAPRGRAYPGAIALGRRRGGGRSPRWQIELLKTFAEQAVIAVASAETYRNLESAHRRFATVAGISDRDQRSAECHQSLDVRSRNPCSKLSPPPPFDLCNADQAGHLPPPQNDEYRWAGGIFPTATNMNGSNAR